MVAGNVYLSDKAYNPLWVCHGDGTVSFRPSESDASAGDLNIWQTAGLAAVGGRAFMVGFPNNTPGPPYYWPDAHLPDPGPAVLEVVPATGANIFPLRGMGMTDWTNPANTIPASGGQIDSTYYNTPLVDGNGKLVILTQNGGLFVWDPASDTYTFPVAPHLDSSGNPDAPWGTVVNSPGSPVTWAPDLSGVFVTDGSTSIWSIDLAVSGAYATETAWTAALQSAADSVWGAGSSIFINGWTTDRATGDLYVSLVAPGSMAAILRFDKNKTHLDSYVAADGVGDCWGPGWFPDAITAMDFGDDGMLYVAIAMWPNDPNPYPHAPGWTGANWHVFQVNPATRAGAVGTPVPFSINFTDNTSWSPSESTITLCVAKSAATAPLERLPDNALVSQVRSGVVYRHSTKLA